MNSIRQAPLAALFGVLLSLISCREAPLVAGAPEPPCETGRDFHLSDAWAPAWSPDGNEVAFEGAFNPKGELDPGIYVVNVHTGAARQVYRERYLASVISISWSSAGRGLLCSRGRSLYVFDMVADSMRLLNAFNEDMSGGAWTWEGDSIYYSRENSTYVPLDSTGLYITSVEGGIGRRVYRPRWALDYPIGPVDVSPGGEWITYSGLAREADGSLRGGGEIYIVCRDGTRLRQLTNLRGFNAHPKWVSGGRAIVFDHYPEECYLVHNWPGHSWIYWLEDGALYQLRYDVGDRRVQFGYPPAIDRSGTQAAFIGLDETLQYGELFLMGVNGWGRRLLYGWNPPTGVRSAARTCPVSPHRPALTALDRAGAERPAAQSR